MKTCLIWQRVTYLKQFFFVKWHGFYQNEAGDQFAWFFYPTPKNRYYFCKITIWIHFWLFYYKRYKPHIYTHGTHIHIYTHTHLHKCMCVSVFVSAWTLYPLQCTIKKIINKIRLKSSLYAIQKNFLKSIYFFKTVTEGSNQKAPTKVPNTSLAL